MVYGILYAYYGKSWTSSYEKTWSSLLVEFIYVDAKGEVSGIVNPAAGMVY